MFEFFLLFPQPPDSPLFFPPMSRLLTDPLCTPVCLLPVSITCFSSSYLCHHLTIRINNAAAVSLPVPSMKCQLILARISGSETSNMLLLVWMTSQWLLVLPANKTNFRFFESAFNGVRSFEEQSRTISGDFLCSRAAIRLTPPCHGALLLSKLLKTHQ